MAMTTLALWQGQDTLATSDGHSLMIAVWVVAGCMLFQVLLIIGAAIGVLMVKKSIEKELAELKVKVMPLVAKAGPVVDEVKGFVGDMKPKVLGITDQVSGVIGDMRPKVLTITDQVSGVIGDMRPKVAEITDKVTAIAGHAENIAALAKDKAHEFSPTISAANETLKEANQTARDANQKTHEQVDRVNDMVSNVLNATTQLGKTIQHTVTQPAREVAGIVSGVRAAMTTLMNQYSKGKPKKAAYTPPVGMYEAPVAAREPLQPDASAYPVPKPDLEP